ncbi:MAG: crossover junction endodeoxyribonuclease RuvC [Acidobacteria bacterium]|nr:crossover junction endodeoxyribonuclease RuvC [Acidobacteriota bacterium]
MRVLGIDPAAAGKTGYGVVETDGRRCRSVHFGALAATRKSAGDGFPARLKEIHARIEALLAEFKPDAIALEGVFAALNVKTALKLAEVRGVVQLAAAQSNIPVHSYSPREIKASIAGYGHAGKPQMQQMVRALLNLREIPQPADAADALAVALCHIQSTEAKSRFAAATEPLPGRANSARAARIQSLR